MVPIFGLSVPVRAATQHSLSRNVLWSSNLGNSIKRPTEVVITSSFIGQLSLPACTIPLRGLFRFAIGLNVKNKLEENHASRLRCFGAWGNVCNRFYSSLRINLFYYLCPCWISASFNIFALINSNEQTCGRCTFFCFFVLIACLSVLSVDLFIAVTDNRYWTLLAELCGSATQTVAKRPIQALGWSNAVLV